MTTDIFRKLAPQTRICKVTGVRRIFEHVRTIENGAAQAKAIFKTKCAWCDRAHVLEILFEHWSRPPMVPDNARSTLCPDCIPKAKPIRNKHGKKVAPKQPACGEDLE